MADKKEFSPRHVGMSKDELLKLDLIEIKEKVEKDAWISLKEYFDGAGNGAAAKIAVVALRVLATEQQAKNNSRQLDLVEHRLALTDGKI